MAIENGEWIMRGMDWDDPARIRSWEELIRWLMRSASCPCSKTR